MPSREEIYVEYCDARDVINELAFEYLDTSARWDHQSKEYRGLIKALTAIESKIEFWDPQYDLFDTE